MSGKRKGHVHDQEFGKLLDFTKSGMTRSNIYWILNLYTVFHSLTNAGEIPKTYIVFCICYS